MGVRRAVQIMQDEATPERPVHSVGEIVHNPYVVQRLSAGGVRQLPGPDEVDGDVGALIASELPAGRVAITAHGVGARVMEDLEATGLEIVDTTCPIVTRAQRYAQKFIRDGYHVLVLGDPGHKEVRGIMGWTDDASGKRRATIVRTPDLEAVRSCMDSFEDGFPSKIGVMVQTTHKVEDFAEFVSNLMVLQRDRNFELHVVNTLCHATTGQQEAAAALARDVEVVVVVGGKKSANTRHLREVCEEQGTTAYHIESPDELQREWFEGIERIGLTAGASTPDYSIDETEARLREMLGA
ncbi:MAG: 4-hydroxy-3-methylbut-2-enyl diphosphate reductase [Dehalococcoidia bacterium]|nr:4-hydroxy-3-methylbut-2-enyl diphosphate reductase [Dehalococcoidia bacterium]